MRQFHTLVLFLLVVNSMFSQVQTSSGTWTATGDVILSTVTSDADNGDGVGDGAQLVNGQSGVVGQGVSFTFSGNMVSGESLSVTTYTYNPNSSYVKFVISLYNATDNKVLATSAIITITNSSSSPVLTNFSYTATATDAGDVLKLHYIRNDDGNTARDFAIDNISLNGAFVTTDSNPVCPFTLTPDLPLMASNGIIESEINSAVSKFSDSYLGTSAPSASALTTAENAYTALNISVSGGSITGDPTSTFSTVSFLKTFAQHLKFNPGDTNIKTKVNNTVWWISKQFCAGTLAIDNQLYSYQNFARPTVLLKDFLDPQVKALFGFTLYQHSVGFEHFWAPTYDAVYQQNNGAINTDKIYNIGDVYLAYSLWQDSADERYRYMRGYKRHMERFFSYTFGTADGLKPDGTGFHHWVAYNNYMFSYSTAANLLYYLSGTSFQVAPDNYKVFRDAFYTQFIEANDAGVQALSTAGRNPQNRTRPFGQMALKVLAIAGGNILGLSTADPLLAGMYNRIYGVEPSFNYSTVTPSATGFFQFNHANAGAFRKSDWVVFNKGFSNNMWGAEAYTNQNRYGRYQSYGALEVIYSGDKPTGNGYDHITWDWNFNPGTTVIRLPWDKLHGEWSRLDEQQQKRFVGALSLKNKNSELLNNTHGDFGMFAMDFQEDVNQGFGTNYTSNVKHHNSAFTFKKSNFYFDDIIVCLGSGISNNDNANETITTLFQRLDNKGVGVNVNGTSQTSTGLVSYNGNSNNWLLTNYNTGFYLVSGNDNIVVKKEVQQTPNQEQTWPVDFSGNATNTYYTGYINHGKNPSNKNYEYILKPNSNATEMQSLHTEILNANKPYIVHKKDVDAHIVEHIAKKVWGYAFFNSATNLIYNYVKGVNASCLVMTEYNDGNKTLLVSIDNPDIGFNSRSFSPSIQVTRQLTLQGQWALSKSYSGVQILSANVTETVIEFTLVDGLAKEVLLNGMQTLRVASSNKLVNVADESITNVFLYPNPANNMIEFSSLENVESVKVISILGAEVGNFRINNNQLNVQNLSNGMYLLKLKLESGGFITKKLIIKK